MTIHHSKTITQLQNYFKKHPDLPKTQAESKELYDILKRVGHVLHVIQDMSSPAYVRNDAFYDDQEATTHLIETWLLKVVGRYAPPPITQALLDSHDFGRDTYEDFMSSGQYAGPANISSIPIMSITDDNSFWVAFDRVASFTNNNFFSDDTIPYTSFDTIPPSPLFDKYKAPSWRFLIYHEYLLVLGI